jgi:hypothetical protein
LKAVHPSSERSFNVSDDYKVPENREEPKEDDVQGHRAGEIPEVPEEPDVEGHRLLQAQEAQEAQE